MNLNRLIDEEFGRKQMEELLPYITLYINPKPREEADEISVIHTTENLCRGEKSFSQYVSEEMFNLNHEDIKECLVLYFMCFNKMTKNKVKSRQRIRLTQIIAKEHIHTEEHQIYKSLHKKTTLDLYEDFLRHQAER